MEGFSRINYSGVVFSRVDREDVRGPQRLKEHTLLYIRSGRAEVVCEDLLRVMEYLKELPIVQS